MYNTPFQRGRKIREPICETKGTISSPQGRVFYSRKGDRLYDNHFETGLDENLSVKDNAIVTDQFRSCFYYDRRPVETVSERYRNLNWDKQ